MGEDKIGKIEIREIAIREATVFIFAFGKPALSEINLVKQLAFNVI
jgi:hypothetical protein